MKMTFQEIRIIATGPCIANQLRDVNTICRRSWYIAAHVWKIYDFKIEGVIRICKSTDTQHNDQRKKDKQRSTKHYTDNIKDQVTRTTLKTGLGGELRCSERVNSSCSTCGTRLVILVTIFEMRPLEDMIGKQ